METGMKRIGTSVFSLLLLFLVSTSALAQTRRITGRVTVEGSGEPLVATSVNIVGTSVGGYTDDQGHFTLIAPDGPVTLRVRRIGFVLRNIPVAAGDQDVAVTLTRDVLQLETQVVTGAATTVSSLNAANDVSVVQAEKLNKVPTPTIDQALQGKIAGAVITQNSGAPGGGTQIQLRGTSTVLGAYSPLYVIDGVIVSNSSFTNGLNVVTAAGSGTASNFAGSQDQIVNRIADLNPNDIESIQVLKGPSAASIYGSKGTNGVVLITTKQGRPGENHVDLTQRFGTYRLANKLGIRCFTSAQDYVDWNGSTTAAGQAADAALYNAATNKCHDYQQEYFGSPQPLSYQTIASLRGGTASGTTYFASGLVQHDNGLALNDFYNKQSLRLNLGQSLGSRVKVQTTTEVIHSLTQRGISGNDNFNVNPFTVWSGTPSFVDLQKQGDGTFPKNPFVLGINPFQDADLIKTPQENYRLIASANGTWNMLTTTRQSLDLTMTGGIDAYNEADKVVSPSNSYFEQGNANPGTLFNGNSNVRFATLTGALAHRLTAGAFTATTSGGIRQERRQTDQTQITGRGLPFPGVESIGRAVQTFPDEFLTLVKDFSYFVQEEFLTLNERLLLTGGVNAERSSNNGDEAKFYGYPKFSASLRSPWTPPTVGDLKLRLAYGRAGNFPTAGRFTFATTVFDEGIGGARFSTIKGATGGLIRPEIASELEGGFDLSFLSGRAGIKATQFKKTVDDLLLLNSLATSTGFAQQYINGGQLSTHGTEVALDLTPVDFRGFNWQSTTTYSSAKSKITRLPVAPFNPGVGSFGSTFGNVFIQQGQSPTVIQAFDGCAVPLSATGTCASFNKILGFVGDANPDYQMGFSNDFHFGAFSLTSLLDWRKGGDVINLTNNYFDGGLGADTAKGNARLALLAAGKAPYVEDATFVKLREVTLGYDLPAAFTNKVLQGRAQNLRLEFSGRNLKTWTKYTGLDPEVSNFSNQAIGRIQDVTPYPPWRSFFFSINTSF
jgi:TonB-linked SusC/RagA family outer membrane protein